MSPIQPPFPTLFRFLKLDSPILATFPHHRRQKALRQARATIKKKRKNETNPTPPVTLQIKRKTKQAGGGARLDTHAARGARKPTGHIYAQRAVIDASGSRLQFTSAQALRRGARQLTRERKSKRVHDTASLCLFIRYAVRCTRCLRTGVHVYLLNCAGPSRVLNFLVFQLPAERLIGRSYFAF